MNTASATKARPTLASSLGAVHVGVREDLEVSRHLFRRVASYVVRDPLTFQSQRLDVADYDVFVRISPNRSLGDIFGDLVKRGKLAAADEERFYQFIFSLHHLGFLRLPISDDKLLFRRYQAKQQARRREKIRGFLFLRIPVWNPSAFLDRTIHLARPLFSRAFFIAWLLLVGFAAYVAAMHWGQIAQPVEGLLAARNLPLIWVTLIVLKVFHEMGHAYACRHYGGHVPEMGVFLILFTPCAYMDASASWGFTRKWERLVVCFAGMYVEGFFAAVAVLVWAATEPSLLHSLAYNVMFLASIVTVLFNLNPLMRFDGYYIFSDLTEIPNLRQRSSQYVLSRLKALVLSLPQPVETGGRRLRLTLLGYGVSVAIYRVTLLLAISALLIMKLYLLGFALSVFMVGGTVWGTLRRLTGYLWHAEEAACRRWRAVALSLLVLIVIPAGLLVVPVPADVRAPALVTTHRDSVVRAAGEGFLTEFTLEPGQLVEEGELLARLTNDAALADIARAEANLRASQIRADAYREPEPVRALQEQINVDLHRRALGEARARLTDLTMRAPHAGRVVECVRKSAIGSYVQAGTLVARIASGSWRARAVLTEEQIARARPKEGDSVEFRSAARKGDALFGVVARVGPVGSRKIDAADYEGLTIVSGGDIAVDVASGDAGRPYFEVEIEFPGASESELMHRMTGVVRFSADAEPIGTRMGRRFVRFWNRLRQG